jgi:RNA polymerase sigma factor (sigma-70 family)
MLDREIVAAIVAGDATALTVAYDYHAAALHAYCRSALSEPADAARAVQDTFVVAAFKLAELRDPSRLRPWLYAVARNECRRRRRGDTVPAGLDEIGEMTRDESADAAVDAEQPRMREIVAAAVAGLNPAERDVIELGLRHDLAGADLADVIGVSADQADALLGPARSRFETLLGPLLVACSEQSRCADLRELLDGWDGRLTVLPHKRVSRHIEHCAECGLGNGRELRRAMESGLAPVVTLPTGLRKQMLRLVGGNDLREAGYCARVVQRAEPLRESGFPVPVAVSRPSNGRRYAAAAAAAVMAFAVLGAGTVVAANVLRHGGPGQPQAAAAGAGPVAPGAGRPAQSAPGSTRARHRAKARARHVAARGAKSTAAATMAGTAASGKPSRRVVRASPKATGAASAPAGSLVASPTTVTLTYMLLGGGQATGSFTLTARGAPVAYTITVPASAAGNLTVTPSAGSLAAGQSVQIRVTASAMSSSPPLVINPGGLTVNIQFSLAVGG